MFLFALIPFVIVPGLRDYTSVQALGGALLVLLALLYRLRSGWELRLAYLPWLLWPLFLFARTDASGLIFSDLALQACALGGAALVALDARARGRGALPAAIIALLTIQAIQIAGIATGQRHYCYRSIFGQENVYQFVNVMGVALAAYGFCLGGLGKFWRGLAALGALLGLLSLYSGDYWLTGRLGVSAGDSIAMQVAVPLGLVAAGGLALLRRWRVRPGLGVALAVLLLLLMWSAPWILLALPVWSSGMSSSITSRLTLWQAILDMVRDYPWGTGVGGLQIHLYDYWPTLDVALFPAKTFFNVAHNHQLHVLAETGWIGFVWSLLLWGAPTLLCVRRYLQGLGGRFLFLASWLLGVQAALVLLEVTQLFFAAQFAAWLLVLLALRASAPAGAWNRVLSLRGAWGWLFLPLVLFLAVDRVQQVRSEQQTVNLELGAPLQELDLPRIHRALELHGRNLCALFYAANIARAEKDYVRAEKGIRAVEALGAMHVSPRLWAMYYHDRGQDSLACHYAWKQLRFSAVLGDSLMHSWADSCPLTWRYKRH